LNGREVAEVRFSKLERTKRVDSEFYQKENLAIDDLLKGLRHESIPDVAFVSDGNHFAISDSFQDKGVPYYRGQDITNQFFVEQSSPIFIDKQTFNEKHMIRSHLKRNDVLLSIVGTVGSVALFSQEINATCSCKIAILRPKQIIPEYLATFLSSKFGQNQIKKFVRGAVQTGFLLEDTDQINVVLFSDDFQREIENLVKQAHVKLEESRALYAAAEHLLLDELGLRLFAPSTENTTIKSFRESFLQTGRLDADYYQPKYDEIERIISGFNSVELRNLITDYSTGYPFDSKSYVNEGFNLIRINNIRRGYLDLSSAANIALEDLKLSPKDIVKENDLLLSMSGTIGNCCKVPPNTQGIINQRILRFNVDGIDKDTLVLVINSIIGTMQLERIGTGGVQTNISSNDIFKIKIPGINADLQNQISNKVEQSASKRDQSKRLLETAKRAVEMAIEEDEQAALEWTRQSGNHS
jgi:restriction endonuclease S subunit